MFFIELIWGNTGYKIIQVSSVQLNKMSSEDCIAQSKVSFCSLLALPCPFPPTPSSSPNPFPPRAASLFCVTMLLFLFCLLNYFVHPIPYRSQIIWYLFSSDWFISHYIIIIGSTMLSQKGKYTSFFFYGGALFHWVNTPVLLSTHLLMGTWVVCKSCLL